MQDIHSVGGGRLFGGGGGGGDRRLRPHPHHPNHQALKCPRCDSLNTKFCYYNNYNLSQPRHFCKSCRRYWTKGGVLRNVPVGGGCRKAKRNSKQKPNSESSAQTQTPAQRERKTNSHSTSETSSTLTVTNNNNNNNNTNVEAVTSVHSSSSVLTSMNDRNTKLFVHARGSNGNNNNNDPGLDQPVTTALLEQGSFDCGIFSEIGSFTNLITSSNEALPFGFSNLLNNAQQNLEHAQNEQWQQQQQEQHKMVNGSSIGGQQELKMQEITSGLLDQTVQLELSELQDISGGNGGFGSLDWQWSGDQGLFDLPNAVDHASYWTQNIQWTDPDHHTVNLSPF